jgi:hypothetical protein
MTMQFVAERLGFSWDAARAREARAAGVRAEG